MSCECEECGKVSIISNITLCEDCYGKELEESKKQGALEELKRIEEAWHHIGSKGVCNYIQKRIKELSGETK